MCKFVEQNVGRLTPAVQPIDEFNRKKMKIFHDINADNHIDENSHPKFRGILTVGYLDSLLKEITSKYRSFVRSISGKIHELCKFIFDNKIWKIKLFY